MKYLILVTTLFFTITTYAQINSEGALKSFVNKCVMALSKQDSVAVNKLLNPAVGFYLIHNNGAFNAYYATNVISFNFNYPLTLLKNTLGLKNMPLKKGSLPTYSCDTEKWNKLGAFYTPTTPAFTLSNICEMRNKYVPDNIPQSTINSFKTLEKNSRLIYIINKSKSLIMLVTFVNNKWYLTAVDDATGDCSA